eukprot:5960186-Amphidinium_carterae.1
MGEGQARLWLRSRRLLQQDFVSSSRADSFFKTAHSLPKRAPKGSFPTRPRKEKEGVEPRRREAYQSTSH